MINRTDELKAEQVSLINSKIETLTYQRDALQASIDAINAKIGTLSEDAGLLKVAFKTSLDRIEAERLVEDPVILEEAAIEKA